MFVPPVPMQIARQCPIALRLFCETEPIDWVGLQLSAFYLNLACGYVISSFVVLTFTCSVFAHRVAAFVASVFTFGSDVAAVQRELLNGTNAFALGLGKMIVDVPFFALYALLFSGVYTLLLRPDQLWFEAFLTSFGIEFSVMGLGYVLSLLMDARRAVATGLMVVFTSTVFSVSRLSHHLVF